MMSNPLPCEFKTEMKLLVTTCLFAHAMPIRRDKVVGTDVYLLSYEPTRLRLHAQERARSS